MMFFVLYYSFAMRPLRLSFIRVRLRTLPPLSLSHPRREQIIFHRLSLPRSFALHSKNSVEKLRPPRYYCYYHHFFTFNPSVSPLPRLHTVRRLFNFLARVG